MSAALKAERAGKDLAIVRSILGAYGVAANATRPPIRRKAYADVVEAVATLLRPRFESGELRGFTDEDAERSSLLRNPERKFLPPLWRIEKECSRLFIQSPEAALVVLQFASPRAKRLNAETWAWDDAGTTSLQHAAEALMARDVLFFARAQRWYTPAADEEPAPSKAELRRVA